MPLSSDHAEYRLLLEVVDPVPHEEFEEVSRGSDILSSSTKTAPNDGRFAGSLSQQSFARAT